MLLALVVVPFGASASGPPSCAISNARTHRDYSSLQNAVGAARAGDTLEVKGSCVGNTSVDKNITLKGITNKPFPGPPTLDGGGIGTVLHITNGRTTVDGLTITNGVADVQSIEGYDGFVGGGIAVSGDTAGARLVNSVVNGNSASAYGGGIDVDEGTLDLLNSTVSGNTAAAGSGGIDTDSGTITLTGSSVSGNTAPIAGGIWNYGGILTLRDSTVSSNHATAEDQSGASGGIVNSTDAGVVTLSGSTSITNNQADTVGGGILNGTGATVLATADWTGLISLNTPDQCFPILTIGITTCGA